MPFLFITGHGVLGAGRTTSVSFDCTELNSLGTQNLVIFALPSRPSCFDSDVVVYKCIVSDLKMRIKSSEKSEKISGAEEWQELHTTPIGILELVRKLGQVNNANSAFLFLKNLLENCHCSAYFTNLQILAAGRHFFFDKLSQDLQMLSSVTFINEMSLGSQNINELQILWLPILRIYIIGIGNHKYN